MENDFSVYYEEIILQQQFIIDLLTEKMNFLNNLLEIFIILISVIFGIMLGSLFIKVLYKN